MVVLLACTAASLLALALLLLLLAGLSRRVGALTDRLVTTKERVAALDRLLADLPTGRS